MIKTGDMVNTERWNSVAVRENDTLPNPAKVEAVNNIEVENGHRQEVRIRAVDGTARFLSSSWFKEQ